MPKRSETNITSRAAETSPPGLMWDREVSGFGLRTLSSGARTWLFKYRALDGGQHWHRIGTFPAMTVDDARKEARALRTAVDKGKDPSKEREEEREAARAARAAAVEKLAESYAKALPGRPSLRGSGAISAEHAAAEAAAVRNAIARMKLEGRPVSAIAPADVLGLLHLEAARPATARMLFGAFGRFLEWCRDAGHLTSNPCDAIPRAKRPKPPPARRRVVALPDLARLWIASDVLPAPLGELARLLIALPVRRGEGARLAWQDVDLTAGVWTLPGAITKNGDPHRIALHPLARALLHARHKAMGKPTSGLAFPSPRASNEVTAWTGMKADMGEAAGFRAWTWHDFRRSFASLMAERGVAEPVADAVLNHRQSGTRGGVLGVYQHAQRWPEQKAAMEKWGAALAVVIAAAQRKRNGSHPRLLKQTSSTPQKMLSRRTDRSLARASLSMRAVLP
ncbi:MULTISPECIES: tyrosine-type recombinase/integrase [Roseomonadaceae]|uniref:Integrase family protein n=1 Tax=Falsiroseomonas oleicola TaxID=2801474 RepID=A0ABS6HC95_9PROT|nr:integrase family protein [Roseomonas oleicola]MBU8546352.1 integrase family protein [Roseomonas oleicola]